MAHRDVLARVYLALSIVLCLAGLAGFAFLFARDFNVYWLILSPVIIAVYQVPAAYCFWLYKRARRGKPEIGKSGAGPEDDRPPPP
jgi:FtsH-binding integral membrane protein